MADHETGSMERIDKTLVVNFFSTSAGEFLKQGLITDKDVQDFRHSLSRNETEHPFDVLVEENSKILYLLEKRYGERGLILNLLHYTWNPALSALVATLHDLGTELLEKAHVYFNRGVVLASDPLSRRCALYSKTITDIAESIASICQTLKNLITTPWLGHSFFAQREESMEFEKGLSSALGFEAVKDSGLGTVEEFPHLANCLRKLLSETQPFYTEPDMLTKLQKWQDILVVRDRLARVADRLDALKFEHSCPLRLLEVQRQQVLSLLVEAREFCLTLGSHFVQSLGKFSQSKTPITSDIKARLSYELGREGLSPAQIEEIVTALIHYCERKHLAPHEILSAECSNIHPLLSKRGLDIFQALTRGDLFIQAFSQEKGETLAKIKVLKKEFHGMKHFVQSLSFISLLAGCGVRTSPKSDMLEFRPPIPFAEDEVTKSDALHKEANPQDKKDNDDEQKQTVRP